MRTAAPTAISLAVGLVLLPGCSLLRLAAPEPVQSVGQACANVDNKKLAAVVKTLEKSVGGTSPKAAGNAFDTFTTVFEAGIEKVENPTVKVQAQLTSIAMRNFAAELRTFKPDRAHASHLKDDLEDVKKQVTKLDELCGWG